MRSTIFSVLTSSVWPTPLAVALVIIVGIVVDSTAAVTRLACHLSVALALLTFLSSQNEWIKWIQRQSIEAPASTAHVTRETPYTAAPGTWLGHRFSHAASI